VRGSQCSERDQLRAAQLVQEIEALPSGYDLAFYPTVLVRQGYQVQDQESGAEEEWTFEASKDGQTLAVRVRLDEQTGESVSIEASPLWQEATGSSPGQREAVAAEPRGERAEVEAQPQEHVVEELLPGEIHPEPRVNEERMESDVVDAGETQAEDTEQPAGPQLGMQEERTDPAGGAVVSVPEQPQVASATESQPEVRGDEKTEDTRSVLHDPTDD
jgi:hypothetical protein